MRTSREEQALFINRWQQSGLSLAAFARQHHLPYHRIVYWAQQHERRQAAHELLSQPAFTEVPRPCAGWTHRQELEASVSVSQLAEVLVGLAHD